MQKLKLKAFDKTSKRIRGVLSINFFNLSITCGYCNDEIESVVGEEPIYLYDGEYKLLRYTGFKDVNGREIYEDDILDFGSDFVDSTRYAIVHETIGYSCVGTIDNSYRGWITGNGCDISDVAHFSKVIGNANVDLDLLGKVDDDERFYQRI